MRKGDYLNNSELEMLRFEIVPEFSHRYLVILFSCKKSLNSHFYSRSFFNVLPYPLSLFLLLSPPKFFPFSNSHRIFLPTLLTSGCVAKVVSIAQTYSQKFSTLPPGHRGGRTEASDALEASLVNDLKSDVLVKETIFQTWELSKWLIVRMLGEKHFEDLRVVMVK